MSFAKVLGNHFGPMVKRRGISYFGAHRVKAFRPTTNRISAQVAGSAGTYYDVSIRWDLESREIIVACECPYADDVGECKHIWATILEADERGISPGQPRGVWRIAFGDSNSTYEDEYDDDDDLFTFDPEAAFQPVRLSSFLDASGTHAVTRGSRNSRQPAWKKKFEEASGATDVSDVNRQDAWRNVAAKQRQIWYVLDLPASAATNHFVVDFFHQERRKSGQLGKIKRLSLRREEILEKATGEDVELLQLMLATDQSHRTNQYGSYYNYYYSGHQTTSSVHLAHEVFEVILPKLCATGRFVGSQDDQADIEQCTPLTWDEGKPWSFRIDFERNDQKKCWHLLPSFRQGDQSRPLSDALCSHPAGFLVFNDSIARLTDTIQTSWIDIFREDRPITVPFKDATDFLKVAWSVPDPPQFQMPDEIDWPQVGATPIGRLRVAPNRASQIYTTQLTAHVGFQYNDQFVSLRSPSGALVDESKKEIILRDRERESELITELSAIGISLATAYREDAGDVQFPVKKLPSIVESLVNKGWLVEADGRAIRRPGEFNLNVKTGVDWFELDGQFDFDGASAKLPALLEALRNGEKYVRLDDGSHGMLPKEWLEKYGSLANLGEEKDGALQFKLSQGALLDALLVEQENNVNLDKGFAEYRHRLRTFEGLEPKQAPSSFQGTLREYQKDGLGWLHFLRDFHFGGCLADDMGLGKTIQVLALLEARRKRKRSPDGREPSLVVVPRSLVFNWIEESRRFTPKLKLLNYTGLAREELRDQFADFDAVITTYGTLRRDVVHLKDHRFDYVILDEAQAIKNAQSQIAKSCRLLDSRYRLAMTGTPIENHLGELWSLFEFLNPGMLGRMAAFSAVAKVRNGKPNQESDGSEDDSGLRVLGNALRPFILRRTKGQVLKELPDKTEQTVYCEMKPKQRRLYDELREFYRSSLADRVRKAGIKKSKIHVLEALLRLRQAACHPGLLDDKRKKDPSAKLEALLEQLREISDEGHKALVFSQFTSLLSIVKETMDKEKITYAYLDGRTRKRQERVERFQNDPNCQLFLISLKAGGHGLNLTAADYVFILDPWWNPAVEAQAIDRAHRIGQSRRVFAYRLICRDTVEEKILQLQQGKQKLADAIVSADRNLIRDLTAEDLQVLLS